MARIKGALMTRKRRKATLKAAKGLLFTGPTGTNVNDVAVVLIR